MTSLHKRLFGQARQLLLGQSPPHPDRRAHIEPVAPLRPVRIAAEIMCVFALLTGAEHMLGGAGGFVHVNPHPYWLPVLIFALAYGSAAGLIAATVATILYLAGPLPPFAGGDDYFAYVLGVSRLPLLWIGTALVIGEVVSIRRKKLIATVRQARHFAHVGNLLEYRYRLASDLNRTLQTRIANEDMSVAHAMHMAARLCDPARGHLPDTIAHLVRAATGLTRFDVYVPMDGRWHPYARMGTTDGPAPGLDGSPLLQAMADDPRIRHVGNAADRAVLNGFGPLAMPVRAGAHGALVGVILFTDVPIDMLTGATLGRVEQAGSSLAQILVARFPELLRPAGGPALHVIAEGGSAA